MTPGGILALDLATVAGWAYGPAAPPRLALGARAEGGYEQPESGSFRIGAKGCDDATFFVSYRTWLQARIIAWRPAVVVWEAPIVGGAGKINRQTIYRLTGLAAVSDLVCKDHHVPKTGEVAPSTIKKHATGNGRADKPSMTDAALLMGWAFGDDNEADALWLHSYASEIWRADNRDAAE